MFFPDPKISLPKKNTYLVKIDNIGIFLAESRQFGYKCCDSSNHKAFMPQTSPAVLNDLTSDQFHDCW